MIQTVITRPPQDLRELSEVVLETIAECQEIADPIQKAKQIFNGSRALTDILKTQLLYAELRRETPIIPIIHQGMKLEAKGSKLTLAEPRKKLK